MIVKYYSDATGPIFLFTKYFSHSQFENYNKYLLLHVRLLQMFHETSPKKQPTQTFPNKAKFNQISCNYNETPLTFVKFPR